MSHDSKLKEVLIKMLQENTGRHMLDSGGAYGRHWERNQKISSDIEVWDAMPEISENWFKYGELMGTISPYHHLVHSLVWDDDIELINQLYDYFDAMYPDDSYFETRVKFVEWLQSYHFRKEAFTKELEAENSEERTDWLHFTSQNWEKIVEACRNLDFGQKFYVTNTYNEENYLSQDMEYITFGDLVGIMIHNGCDARGGYTRPKFFRIIEENFFNYQEFTAYCDGERDHYWDNRGGYWDTETEVEPNNENCVEYEKLSDEEQAQFDKFGYILDKEEEIFATEGQIVMDGFDVRLNNPATVAGKFVFKDGKAYCPICGNELHLSVYWS